MTRVLTVVVVLLGLAGPGSADGEKDRKAGARTTELKTAADKLPGGVENFNGMLVGRLAQKDVEAGTFIVLVDAVPRVWRNSKAKDPKSLVGKHIKVDGVFGKWLDVLLVVKKGETLEFEARHDGGDQLTFPGELMRKTAPVKPGDYPEFPEDFRGFRGVLAGTVVKKDDETAELTVKVTAIKQTAEESKAKQPKSILGKPAMVIGFWRQRDAYNALKVGDAIECETRHIQPRSDHLTVGKFHKIDEGDE